MARQTTYYNAVHWLHNNYILCNRIPETDDSVWDNMRFPLFGDEEDSNGRVIYQWFLTDASQSDVEYLEESFGLLFTYSDLLDCFVLCVDHYGTNWHGVPCSCYNDDIADSYLLQEL